MRWSVVNGDCAGILRRLPAESVDAVVTDPPYGLSEHRPADVRACLASWLGGEPYAPDKRGFMGRAWDAWVPGPEVWREVYRVLKPGGHALVFAGSRTQDLMGIALRLAGFEVRDSLSWLYGTGFPKSLDVSKAVDATLRHGGSSSAQMRLVNDSQGVGVGACGASALGVDTALVTGYKTAATTRRGGAYPITAPATPEAARWAGFGTALKPAHEPILLVRKPLAGTVASNVLEHGTGALNIDGCRINPGEHVPGGGNGKAHNGGRFGAGETLGERPVVQPHTAGRWPANVVLDEGAAELLDEQAGERSSGAGAKSVRQAGNAAVYGSASRGHHGPCTGGDSGGASRFFYTAKASAAEREVPRASGDERRNKHPTVKPIDLMRWLVRLVTPPGGLVLDPFCGSGSTGVAAVIEGFNFVGVELEEASAATARERIAHGGGLLAVEARQPGLFGASA